MEKLKHLLHGNDDAHHNHSTSSKDANELDSHSTLGGTHSTHPSDDRSGLAHETDKHLSSRHNANATGADRTAERSTLDDVQGGRLGTGGSRGHSRGASGDIGRSALQQQQQPQQQYRESPSTPTKATHSSSLRSEVATHSASPRSEPTVLSGTPAVGTAEGRRNADQGGEHDEPDVHSEMQRSPVSGHGPHKTFMGSLLDPSGNGGVPMQPWTGGLTSRFEPGTPTSGTTLLGSLSSSSASGSSSAGAGHASGSGSTAGGLGGSSASSASRSERY